MNRNSRISKGAYYLHRVISRCIIDDDDFIVWPDLRENRFQLVRYVTSTIIGCHTDTDSHFVFQGFVRFQLVASTILSASANLTVFWGLSR